MQLIATRTSLWCARHSSEAIQLTAGQPIDLTGWGIDSINLLLESGYAKHADKNPVEENKAINPVVETKSKAKKEKKLGDK